MLPIIWGFLSQHSFNFVVCSWALGDVNDTLRERGDRFARIEFTLQVAVFSFCSDFIS